MGLLKMYVVSELSQLKKQRVRLRVIGDLERLAPDIRDHITKAVEETAENDDFHLTVAISYGGQQEIVTAMQHIAQQVEKGRYKQNT